MRARSPLPPDIVDQMNRLRGGFNEVIGLRFTRITHDEVVAEVPVGPHLLQPYGLVHGGVYTAMIETLASCGAALNAQDDQRHTVGLENSTSFLRAVRAGVLLGIAVPLSRGRRSHVWSVKIDDENGRLVAQGRVRMLCIEHGAAVAGEIVAVQPPATNEPDPGERA